MSALICTESGTGGCVLTPRHGGRCLSVLAAVPILMRPRQRRP